MESKLNLNMDLVAQARASAAKVADDVQAFIDEHTTVTVERAVCRLLGIDGINDVEAPLPNIVVDHLLEKGILPGGAAFYIGNAMAELGLMPQQIAEQVSVGQLDLSKLPDDASQTLRIVRIGDYDACACIGAHVSNTAEVGEFRIISHSFDNGVWRLRWKVIR